MNSAVGSRGVGWRRHSDASTGAETRDEPTIPTKPKKQSSLQQNWSTTQINRNKTHSQDQETSQVLVISCEVNIPPNTLLVFYCFYRIESGDTRKN